MGNEIEKCDTYINIKSFSMGKTFNIPFGTKCICNSDGLIIRENKDGDNDILCYFKSENAYRYFVPMIDDHWLERGNLQKAIWNKIDSTVSSVEIHDKCFDILLEDTIANKYRKMNDDVDRSMFNWDRLKFNYAPLYDLQHMWSIIKDVK
jgi:hypothetical protein